MRTPTRLPTPCASRSRHCANVSANHGSSPPWRAWGTASRLNQTATVGEPSVDRAPGLSVRLKLMLSYAGFLMFAGALMLAAIWVFQYAPDAAINAIGRFVPDLLRDPTARAAAVLAFLLVFGLLGGWLLAG